MSKTRTFDNLPTEFEMRQRSAILLLVLTTLMAASADAGDGYQVSPNKRYLLAPNGKPFFWLGDTAWALCHTLKRDEAVHYLDKRAEQGFTVIQLPAVMSRYVGKANAFDDKPFRNDDLSAPNTTPGNDPKNPAQYDYWDHVEFVIDEAAERDLTVGLLPFFVAFGPGWDYLNTDNAYGYGRFIGKRLGNKTNIIWILGGDDRAETEKKRDVWDAVAKGIAEGAVGSEDYSKLLMTYHSPGGTSSSHWLHDKPWLDFNMIQTWSKYSEIYDRVAHDYNLSPTKPTGLGEGAYENGPEYPTKPITAAVVRRQAYWSYLAGGYHTYGNTSIWNFGTESRYAKKPWKEALTDPGAQHLSIAASFLQSIDWWRLVPDQTVFAKLPTGTSRNVAMRAPNGDRVVVYFATRTTAKIRLSKLAGKSVRATWVDPKTGARTPHGQLLTTESPRSFSVPKGWEDALLLLEPAN